MDGSYFLIYTTEQGGFFKAPLHKGQVMLYEPEDFDRMVRTRELVLEPLWGNEAAPEPETLYFVALCQVIKNHDFVLGHSRDHFPQGQ